MGTTEQPSKIGRRISPTEPQVDQYENNELGNTTKHTDTLGRVRKWQYDATGIDVLSVKQQNGATDETLVTFTYHASDPPRHPRTVTDASGQITTFSWNARGQIAGITQPGSLVTSWNYSTTGYLLNPELIPFMITQLWSGDFRGIAGLMSCFGSAGVVGLGIVPRFVRGAARTPGIF